MTRNDRKRSLASNSKLVCLLQVAFTLAYLLATSQVSGFISIPSKFNQKSSRIHGKYSFSSDRHINRNSEMNVIHRFQLNSVYHRARGAIKLQGLPLLSLQSSNTESNTESVTNQSDDDRKKTNEYLAQARISVKAAKRETRKSALEQDKQRNLKLKRLLHTEAGGATGDDNDVSETGFQIPKMYQIRISVDKTLRDELRMNGREKRGRVFMSTDSEGVSTIKGLKFEIHAFFRALKKSSYLLSANVPTIQEDGSIFSPGDEQNNLGDEVDRYKDFWDVGSDNEVAHTFEKANTFFEQHNSNLSSDAPNRLKRPSIMIHVSKDPNAPKPLPPPPYLKDMADPKETKTMTMLSFYSFPPGGIEDAEDFGTMLRKVWKVFGALGRVYVAKEGVNAQMSIPTNVLSNFRICCLAIPELGEYMENGINVDPIALTMEEFAVSGDMDGKVSDMRFCCVRDHLL